MMQENGQILTEQDFHYQGMSHEDFPSMHPLQAEISNRWYGLLSTTDLNIGGVKLQAAPDYSAAPAFTNHQACFIVSCSQSEIGLALDRKLITRILETLYEDVNFDLMNADDKALLAEFLLTPALEVFEEMAGAGLSFSHWNGDYNQEADCVLTGCITIGGSDETYKFHLVLPEDHTDFWNSLLGKHEGQETRAPSPLENMISVPLTFNYQSVEMELGTVNNLENGDIILLGHAERTSRQLQISAGGTHLWSATRQSDSCDLLITGKQNQTLLAVNEITNKGGSSMNENGNYAALEEVPVVLSFEVGRKDVTVKQLREIQEGSVVSFSGEAGKEVQIVINGKEVGWGSLVRVGDDVGVKIERIFVNG